MMLCYDKKLSRLLFSLIITAMLCSHQAFAVLKPLSNQEIEALITRSHFNSEFQILAKPEVVKEINTIRRVDYRNKALKAALQRMHQYHTVLQATLKKYHMPQELLAIPIIETNYQLSPRQKGRYLAGIWQITTGTGRRFGLIINAKRDDRLSIVLSTNAACRYLTTMHAQFHNWILAVLAYQYGEQKIQRLVKRTGSTNVWVLANSPSVPKNFKRMLTLFNADVIVMVNPSILLS